MAKKSGWLLGLFKKRKEDPNNQKEERKINLCKTELEAELKLHQSKLLAELQARYIGRKTDDKIGVVFLNWSSVEVEKLAYWKKLLVEIKFHTGGSFKPLMEVNGILIEFKSGRGINLTNVNSPRWTEIKIIIIPGWLDMPEAHIPAFAIMGLPFEGDTKRIGDGSCTVVRTLKTSGSIIAGMVKILKLKFSSF